MKRIAGAGGGGKGDVVRSAMPQPDNLKSKAVAKIIDLLSEGEIEGLVNGDKSIYLDDTPLQAADGSYNFPGLEYATRVGTQGQAYVPGFSAVENTLAVGVEIKQATPIVRTFTNPNLNALLVTVAVPALTYQNTETGNLTGTEATIGIEVQTGAGAFVAQDLRGAQRFAGKTTTRYQRTFRIPLTGTGPWTVRVSRISPDSSSSFLQNSTVWDSVTEVIDAKLRYPNSALVALSFDAAQFSQIPRRAYDVKLLRVRVPSNYNPTTRAYTGAWDGTFSIAWTDNPAWCFYDLITSDRYGLGEFIDAAQVDKWALYAIGRYCDEMVPDGFGGMEPRFTCNLYLQSRAEAYNVLRDFASIFRGMVFWSSGAVTAVQDAPSDPVALFSPANVIDGTFTYSGSSAKARHTVALVTWNDPADLYRQKVEYVEDRAGIERYGVITTEIAAIGCTSRGQANRAGRWLLFSERLESEVVSFKTGLDGVVCRPGQVIKVADPARAGVRYGGRLLAATTTSATLDAAVTLVAGQTYTLSCLGPDGSLQETTVTNSPGTTASLTLSPALPGAPIPGTMWVLASQQVEAQLFRVLSVTEDEKHLYTVNALAHEPNKFDAVEQDLVLEPRSISALSARPATPQGFTASETYYSTTAGFRSRLDVSWLAVEGATSYVVTTQRAGGNVSPEMVTTITSIEINDLQEDTYTVTVAAVNPVGSRSLPASFQFVVLGKRARPNNVTGFVASRAGDTLKFAWRPIEDIDADYYEIRQGAAWETGVVVGRTRSTTYETLSPRGGTYMIKAYDTSSNESQSESTVIVSDAGGINVVLSYNEAIGGWNGTKDRTAEIVIVNTPAWADIIDWTSMGTWDDTVSDGGVVLVGTSTWASLSSPWTTYSTPWLFSEAADAGTYVSELIDIGYVATSLVQIDPLVQILARSNPPWADFTEPWAYYGPPDWTWQGKDDVISAGYEIATSNDNVTWSAYTPFLPGAYRFRYARFRVTLETSDPNYRPFLTRFVVKVDVPDRVEHFGNVSIPSGGATITFSPQFVGVDTVQVTLQSAASGDRFTVTGKTTSSVTVSVFDSAGSPKAGTADVDVFGYGERT